MSAWLVISIEDDAKSGNKPLKIDRQYLSSELQRLWPNITITLENNQTETLRWWLSIQERNVVKESFDGDISFSYNHDCVIIDAHSSASYVAKFLYLYREIVPEIYRLSVGNDWGGPEDQFDLISEISETEIYSRIRDWVND